MDATVQKYKLDLDAPHTRYMNAAGKRLPGVTTALGVLDKPALLEWAAREERAEIVRLLSVYDHASQILDLIPEPYAYAVKRDKAADAGSLAHARIHAFLRGTELDEEGHDVEALALALNAYQRWLAWWTDERMDCVASELPLVSEALQVGGTLDIMGDGAHGLTLCDVKSTNRPKPGNYPYDEHVGQVAAYRLIWNETHPEQPICRTCICRVGKEANDPGEVTWLTIGQLTAGEDLFRSALAAYRAKNDLGRMKR